jgi:hypothetical protein
MTGWIERPDSSRPGRSRLCRVPVCQIAQPGLDLLTYMKELVRMPAGSPSPSWLSDLAVDAVLLVASRLACW